MNLNFFLNNIADPHSLDLFRRFHCADCLKSFRQQGGISSSSSISNSHHHQTTQEMNPTPLTPHLTSFPLQLSSFVVNNNNNNNRLQGDDNRIHQSILNNNTNGIIINGSCLTTHLTSLPPLDRTPPPPLQPIVDETLTGLYNYFGTGSGGTTSTTTISQSIVTSNNHNTSQPPPPPPPVQPPAPQLSSIRLVCNNTNNNNPQSTTNSNKTTVGSLLNNNTSESTLITPQTEATTSMDHDGQIDSSSSSQQQSVFSFGGREVTTMSLQEKRHALNRKLAQRAPKHELVERGILPRKKRKTFNKIMLLRNNNFRFNSQSKSFSTKYSKNLHKIKILALKKGLEPTKMGFTPQKVFFKY